MRVLLHARMQWLEGRELQWWHNNGLVFAKYVSHNFKPQAKFTLNYFKDFIWGLTSFEWRNHHQLQWVCSVLCIMNSSDLIQYKLVDSHRVVSLKGNIIAILMTTEMFSDEACLSCEFTQPDEKWMRLYFLEWISALSLVSIQWTPCLADLLRLNHVPERSGCIWTFRGKRETA